MYSAWGKLRAHRRRVDDARRVFDEAAALGPLVVSSSWGKDSVALCHLAIDLLGAVPIVHLASPYSLPGYDDVVRHFSSLTTVHTIPASRSLAEYIEWCRDIGLPHERTRASQGRVVSEIKRHRGADVAKEIAGPGVVQVLGMRAEESRTRRLLFRRIGCVYQRADGARFANPLAWWSSRDTWAYIVAHDLPYNRQIYDAETCGLTRETIRNTGWLSTDGAEHGRLAWLRQHFPAQYRELLTAFTHLRTLG